jgi:dTDP-glucose pyrophosphorylase
MLNIVIPMAGRGSRFVQAGFDNPKPLIPLGGKPMVQWVIENLRPACPHRFIFVCLQQHLEQSRDMAATLQQLAPGCAIVPVRQVTEGAACTVLLARDLINGDDPLMIANSDQFVELDLPRYLEAAAAPGVDGLIMTFWAQHPKWSYCRMRTDGSVGEVVEKKVISNVATVGIYNFRSGRDFVRAGEEMIAANLRVNNEFYVAPVYNLMIQSGAQIRTFEIGPEGEAMFGLGTPEDFAAFQQTTVFRALANDASR